MSLSKRNRRGLFGLIIMCLLIAITPRILTAMFSVGKTAISFEEVNKIHLDITAKKSSYQKQKKKTWKSRYSKPSSKFHPKEYTLKDWMKLGLSEKQAKIVLKFTARGISDEEELKRIFVIPEELVTLIKDSIIYSPKEFTNQKREENYQRKIETVDINLCSVADLEKLPGIGNYFATKIVEYRTKLGGYHSNTQLLEIWNFDNEKLDKITPYIIHSNSIKKLDVNEATTEELKAHPYIHSYGIANSIVKMRAQSKFKTIEDVKRSKLIDEELFEKIKPYLECK